MGVNGSLGETSMVFIRLRFRKRLAQWCSKDRSTFKMVMAITFIQQSERINLSSCPCSTSIVGSLASLDG